MVINIFISKHHLTFNDCLVLPVNHGAKKGKKGTSVFITLPSMFLSSDLHIPILHVFPATQLSELPQEVVLGASSSEGHCPEIMGSWAALSFPRCVEAIDSDALDCPARLVLPG